MPSVVSGQYCAFINGDQLREEWNVRIQPCFKQEPERATAHLFSCTWSTCEAPAEGATSTDTMTMAVWAIRRLCTVTAWMDNFSLTDRVHNEIRTRFGDPGCEIWWRDHFWRKRKYYPGLTNSGYKNDDTNTAEGWKLKVQKDISGALILADNVRCVTSDSSRPISAADNESTPGGATI